MKFLSIILSSIFLLCNTVDATQIVAIVDTEAITDTDIDKFRNILCYLNNKPFNQCQSNIDMYYSLMTLIDLNLKKNYLNKIDIMKFISQDAVDNYVNDTVKNIHSKVAAQNIHYPVNQLILRDYIGVEYLWNNVVSGTINKDIDNNEMAIYKKSNNVNSNEEATQQIISLRMQQKSEEFIRMLRKVYFVEIR